MSPDKRAYRHFQNRRQTVPWDHCRVARKNEAAYAADALLKQAAALRRINGAADEELARLRRMAGL